MGLNIYLVFAVSWFLHLGTRVPVLGLIRFDLVLIIILFLLIASRVSKKITPSTQTEKLLKVLVVYSIVTIPFVEWPGSVVKMGLPEFVKAIVFYYFTVAFIVTETDLKKFVFVFLGCQLFRVLEPLYLHITEGYWGSFASMADWEYMDRLSGAPSDVINPNGLAFVICTVIPFLYYLGLRSWGRGLVTASLSAACIYALILTGSRSGMLGLVVVYFGILAKAKRRVLLAVCGLVVVLVGFPQLSPDTQDRYGSIFGLGKKNESSALGRWEGISASFDVALQRPVFGHGLGTSREAMANFASTDQPAHNLYAEVAQELGFVGLAIFLLFMKAIASSFAKCKRAYATWDSGSFLSRVVDAMQVWLWMNVIFSFASYGLRSYEWYLLAGFSVVLTRLAENYAGSKDARVGVSRSPRTAELGA